MAGFFWLGGTIYRGIIAYRLFEPFSLVVRSELTYESIAQTLLIIGGVTVYILAAYILFIVFYVCFIFDSKIKFKQNGWFFMCTIIFAIFLPIEFFLMNIDVQFVLLVHSQTFDLNQGMSLLIQRIGALSGLPAIALFSYFTTIWLAIFQPLKRQPI
jgi:hypothetical protein